MARKPDSTPLVEVWMDGSCELCRRSQAWCELRDPRDHVVFRDFRAAKDHDLPVKRGAHEESMWARTIDGELHKGFAAWRLIMSQIPRWRWLARITGLPPFSWFGPPVYQMVARFRKHLV